MAIITQLTKIFSDRALKKTFRVSISYKINFRQYT